MQSSGGLTTWAVGTGSDSPYTMAVYTGAGPGDWQTFAYPFHPSPFSQNFIAAYPETGTSTIGFATDGTSQVAYFNGQGFGPINSQTFAGVGGLNLYASQGNVWGVGFNGKVSVSNANNNDTWSPIQQLPFTIPLSSSIAVSGNMLYFMVPNAQSSLSFYGVNNQGAIQKLNAPAVPFNPAKIILKASGGILFVALFGPTNSIGNVYCYSMDGGQSWIMLSNTNAPQMNAISATGPNINVVNDSVIASPIIGSYGNGAYVKLQSQTSPVPAWQIYANLPAGFPTGTASGGYTNFSADGTEQCAYSGSVVACFNLGTSAWTLLPGIDPTNNLSISGVVTISSDALVVLAQNSGTGTPVQMTYDGSWSDPATLANLIGVKLATPLTPSYNPANVWAFGMAL